MLASVMALCSVLGGACGVVPTSPSALFVRFRALADVVLDA